MEKYKIRFLFYTKSNSMQTQDLNVNNSLEDNEEKWYLHILLQGFNPQKAPKGKVQTSRYH